MEAQIRNTPVDILGSCNSWIAEVNPMKQLKLYLDTNFIYDYFQRKVEELAKGKEFFETGKLTFIENNKESIESYTSFFTLIEVANRLKEDFKLTSEEIIQLIKNFTSSHKITILDNVVLTKDALIWFLSGISWKDSIQLNIAKNEESIFITDDEKLFRRARKFYTKILKFKGLKKQVNLIKSSVSASSLLRFFPFSQE